MDLKKEVRLRKTAQGADRYGNNRPSFKPKYTQLHNHTAYKLINVCVETRKVDLHKSVGCHLPAPQLTNTTAHKHTVHTPSSVFDLPELNGLPHLAARTGLTQEQPQMRGDAEIKKLRERSPSD